MLFMIYHLSRKLSLPAFTIGLKQILDDPPLPGLDLGGDVHARAQAHALAVVTSSPAPPSA